jgi:hypothetical protein
MQDINWLNFFELYIFPLLGLGTFVPAQISLWSNVLSFINRPSYFVWDYGDHYTITSSRYADCGAYSSFEIIDFVSEMNTGYIVFMYCLYYIATTAAFLFGTVGVLLRRQMKSESMKKKFRVHKTMCNFAAFCFSVSSFYCSKIHYGDCIGLSDSNLLWMMSTDFFAFGVVGFWMFILTPCIFCLDCGNSGFCCFVRLYCFFVIAAFFAEALLVNYGFVYDLLQVPWSIYLNIDSLFQVLLVCLK